VTVLGLVLGVIGSYGSLIDLKHSRYSSTEIQGVRRDSLRIMLDLQKHVFGQTDLKGVALTNRVLKFLGRERYKRKQNKIPAPFFIDTKSGAVDGD